MYDRKLSYSSYGMSKVLLREVSPLPYIYNVNDGRQFRSSNSSYIHSPAPHGGVFFFVCVPVLTVIYTLISWHSNRISILTFNQSYNFSIVEVMLTTNLEIGIWTSGETSLNKTLV